jgi:hypothetical protein
MPSPVKGRFHLLAQEAVDLFSLIGLSGCGHLCWRSPCNAGYLLRHFEQMPAAFRKLGTAPLSPRLDDFQAAFCLRKLSLTPALRRVNSTVVGAQAGGIVLHGDLVTVFIEAVGRDSWRT